MKFLFASLLFLAPFAFAGDDTTQPVKQDVPIVKAADLKWDKGPDFLPEGAEIAVLDGDPMTQKMFAVRVRLPAGYVIPPHFHGHDENITIIEGKLMLGHGDKLVEADMLPLVAGDFVRIPADDRHYIRAEEQTILQLHGTGPFEIEYVNKEDDPRN